MYLNKLSMILVAALMGATTHAAPTNAELKIGMSQEFENLNPLIGTMVATTYMQYLVNRSMMTLTPESKWAPQMAKSVPSLTNGGAKLNDPKDPTKGMTVTWEIIPKAKWGDGKDVTCDDIKFAWEAGQNENISVGERESYTNISSITWNEKTPKKCVIAFKKARWDFYKLTPTPLPRHIEGPVLEKYGKTPQGYDQNSEYTKNPTNPGLYNGPYVISELKLGSHVTFTPNPHFYGQQPNIKKIIFKLIPNTGTMEANLRSGTIDMICTLGLAFDQAVAFDKKVNAEKLPFKVLFKEGTTYEHIDLNLDNPILADIKVRKALVYAINREELTKAIFEGKQRVAVSNVSPVDANWYTESPAKITLYKSSKKEAAKLLDEAGWKMGADGFRSKDGKRLSLSFMTTAGNKTRETVQTYLQSQWKGVGIEVLIKNEPARVFFAETTRKRAFTGMVMYAWVSSPESSPRSTLHSTSIPSSKNAFSGQNQPGWINANVDKYLDQLDVEFNSGKRRDLVQKTLKEYTEQVPVIPLFYRSEIAVVPTNLENFRIAGHQVYETNEVEKWNLK